MGKRKDEATATAHEEELALYMLKQEGFELEPGEPYPRMNRRAQTFLIKAQLLLRDWSKIRRAALRRADRG